jgi:tetratricopeptide (TPR) repeat protein
MADMNGGARTIAVGISNAGATLHVNYLRALQWGKGYVAEETREAYERAGEVAAVASNAMAQFSPLYGRFMFYFVGAEYDQALEVADLYLKQAQATGQPSRALYSHHLRAIVKFMLGEFADSLVELERATPGWIEEYDVPPLVVLGADELCALWSWTAYALVVTGEIDSGVAMAERAIHRAETIGDMAALAYALNVSAIVYLLCERWEDAATRSERLVGPTTEMQMAFWELAARSCACAARGRLRDTDENIVLLRDCIHAKRQRGEWQSYSTWLRWLAGLQALAGANDEALAALAEALAFIARTGERAHESPIHRQRGDILVLTDPAAAEAAYAKAIEIARTQGARTYELQAALRLAKLLQSIDRPLEARDVLGAALESFTPTTELPAFSEAQALFEALQP